jgi:hypothetical protein
MARAGTKNRCKAAWFPSLTAEVRNSGKTPLKQLCLNAMAAFISAVIFINEPVRGFII